MAKQLEMNPHDVHQLVQPEGEQRFEFLKQTESVLGIRFPDEYLLRGHVLSLVDQSQLICGGAIVVLEAPFRSVVAIPECTIDIRSKLGPPQECAELNGVWLLSGMKSPYLTFTFWRLLISHLLLTNKHRFIFTFDNSNDRMKEVAVVFKPEILYSGKTVKLEGMKEEADETIAIVNREGLVAVWEMLERRGIGEANPQEQKIIQRIERRSKHPSLKKPQ